MKSTAYKWEDGTPKSHSNAFNWKGKTSQISQQTDFINANRFQKQIIGKVETRDFPTYSKAVAVRYRD